VQGCNSVASYQLRNRATVGGNLCNASPAADTAPALLCLDAVAEIYGPGGLRLTPLNEFFTGPGRTVLQSGEFLAAIHLPPLVGPSAGAFNKLGRTKMGDISVASVAVWAGTDGGRTTEDEASWTWRIVIGAAGPTPLRAPEAESALVVDRSPEGVNRAAELASHAARPIDDIRASALYRRAMVAVLARRGIESALSALDPAPSSFALRPSSPGGAA
jgi:carbon-monoxide dehydrogenase medium subunit